MTALVKLIKVIISWTNSSYKKYYPIARLSGRRGPRGRQLPGEWDLQLASQPATLFYAALKGTNGVGVRGYGSATRSTPLGACRSTCAPACPPPPQRLWAAPASPSVLGREPSALSRGGKPDRAGKAAETAPGTQWESGPQRAEAAQQLPRTGGGGTLCPSSSLAGAGGRLTPPPWEGLSQEDQLSQQRTQTIRKRGTFPSFAGSEL